MRLAQLDQSRPPEINGFGCDAGTLFIRLTKKVGTRIAGQISFQGNSPAISRFARPIRIGFQIASSTAIQKKGKIPFPYLTKVPRYSLRTSENFCHTYPRS